MLPNELQFIIAIGASAGGMEEINIFFDHTPLDKVSYVIVQHLSPDFKSRMIELLARHSKLVVQEAENGMDVLSNQVYLIPHNKFMTIESGRLYLTAKDKAKGPHLTINTFFNSLAADIGNKAIGVILSGLGSDGTEGVKAIKKAGGMVMVRNPETSQFSSMPSNAIATGLVDFVLEPQLMPQAIEDYVKHEKELQVDIENDDKSLTAIIELIHQRSPLDFSGYKRTTILRRTKRRAAYNNFSRLEKYLEFLQVTPGELEALAQDFLISVTSFFRDDEAFGFIQTNIIPGILNSLSPNEELKMWIAGCATGEEAYSMAILICERLTKQYKDTVVKIFATDIDVAALDVARKGIFSEEITRHVSSERLKKYFTKEGNSYKISTDIRKMVIFAQHDLVKNPPYCNMHFVSCRNMLIYLTPVMQKKVFAMLLFGLKKEGYLFLGSSETPGPIMHALEVVNKKLKIYRKLETKHSIGFDSFSFPPLKDITHQGLSHTDEDVLLDSKLSLTEAVNISLITDLDYLVVCVDERNQVVRYYGNTTKYLLPKNFNSNLTELLTAPLAVAYSTLRINALKSNKKVSVKGIKIKHGQLLMKVSMSVRPLPTKKSGAKLMLVTFGEDRDSVAAEDAIEFDEHIYINKYTLNLEEEIKELKDKLHSSFELLDASSENMQSFNEELVSANEEMQSTNEEMQSVNEELHTINADYQLKNKELLELNDDLNNYFRSNINGQLFVNNDCLLIKFSPACVNLINLLPTDIGRPISNISTNIKFETLVADISEVLEKGNVVTKEIETINGDWYQVMTMPYVLSNNQRKGAIITFNAITELKKTQNELASRNKSLLRINADLDNFVHTASHDLLAPLNNIEASIAIMNEIEVTDPQLNDFLQIINTSVVRFRQMVTDISNVARTENDLLMMERVEVDKMIDDIAWSLTTQIQSAKAVLVRDLEVTHILFSRKNLRSILYNLVSNSIKYMGDQPPVVKICTYQKDGNDILSVEDNGIGLSPESMNTIFNLYGRIQHDIDGQGIGLYLTRKIVNAAGGSIVVESEPGRGSKFIIHLKSSVEGK